MVNDDGKWVKRAAVTAGVGLTGVVGILTSNPPEKKLPEPVPQVQQVEPRDPNAPPRQRLADLPVPDNLKARTR